MTTTDEDLHERLHAGRQRVSLVLAVAVTVPGIVLRLTEPHLAEPLLALLYGLAIVGAAFLLFLLVQWLAPLASEAPELLVAGLYAWRLNTDAGLGTRVSSKVNQWTLLVGTLPIAFAVASGSVHGLPIIGQQRQELLLTAAQSVFVLAIVNRAMSVREAGALFGLFIVQFIAGAVGPESIHDEVRIVTSVVYLALGAWLFFSARRAVPPLLRDGFRTSYATLSEE